MTELEDARVKARALLVEVDQGGDPQAKAKATSPEIVSWKTIAERAIPENTPSRR